MRINKFIAQATGISRRAADQLIEQGGILINGYPPTAGHDVTDSDKVTHNGRLLQLASVLTIMLNKPAGYVVSRDGQGSDTIYELLPADLHNLKPVGRLDKYSSGLLLMTNDGQLTQDLTHPSRQKIKVYEIVLGQDLSPLHRQMISDHGVQLEDGPSKFELERLTQTAGKAVDDDRQWQITMREGRNRQIRRTFLSLGYGVSRLHRIQFGDYLLGGLQTGKYREVPAS